MSDRLWHTEATYRQAQPNADQNTLILIRVAFFIGRRAATPCSASALPLHGRFLRLHPGADRLAVPSFAEDQQQRARDEDRAVRPDDDAHHHDEAEEMHPFTTEHVEHDDYEPRHE